MRLFHESQSSQKEFWNLSSKVNVSWFPVSELNGQAMKTWAGYWWLLPAESEPKKGSQMEADYNHIPI